MRTTLLSWLTVSMILAGPAFTLGQKNPADNLIPNPGFELFSDPPSGWYYSGKDFSRVSLYWTSPTDASPDIYGPGVNIPNSWAAVGFGKTRPYQGAAYAGLTVYGCDKGKPHCREYIQVQLTEPLVPGQRYGFSCMLSHLAKSVSVRNIGLWFSEHEIDEGGQAPLLRDPVLSLDRFLPSDGKWYRWSGHFIAASAASYVLIGNFRSDEDSPFKWPSRSDLRYGYYYIDDVRLFKIPPIITPPPMDSPLAHYIPKAGEVVSLSRIYFEHDRSDFMPRALIQLDQLLAFLKKYPSMQVEIIGHTDSVGTDEYNRQLSIRRSAAVLQWLVRKGIDRQRLTSTGYGSTQPVASNITAPGRAENRRVEIRILKL